MNKTAALFINIPLKGIVRACRIPPKADSLNAHKAVILTTEIWSFIS